jgi:hypothetical protein
MKDFAGSSITYYGLAREKLMNKYPRLISVLVILALICMTGLAIFLISDLVSFASNPDHKGVLVGLDLKGPENGIVPVTNGKEKSGNISANSSRSLSQMNASLPSSQAAKGVVAASKSSSSSSPNYVDEKMGNSPVKKHHSSSSSSSSKSAKKSNDKNNLTNETAKITAPTNQSIGGITNPAKDTSAREPVSIIKFKTKATLSPKSEQGLNTDNGINTDGATVSDNSNKVQSSKDATKNPNSQAIGTKSASSQKSKVTASGQAKKAQEARAKLKANRNRIAENMKKKAAQSRAKAAPN